MKKLIPLLLVLAPITSFALETDQFMAAPYNLKDASGPLNEYVNSEIDEAVSDSKSDESCADISDRVMTEIVGKYSISKISQFAKKSPDIERFPNDSIKDREYLKQSFYREAGFPFNFAKISRTINVGGVYIGTDKLGHFALVGRNYYRRFLREIKDNSDELVAEKATVMNGIRTEVAVLGYTLGGVLSFGDLEANYRGMMFARSLCTGSNPYLVKKDNIWKRTDRKFEITEHINPRMDESYRPAFWKPNLWEKVKPLIAQSYCELKSNPVYIERIAKYPAMIVENRNDKFIEEYFSDKPKFDRKLRDIDQLCE